MKAESANVKRPIWCEIDDLFHTVLDLYYGDEEPAKAAPFAMRLLRLLDKHDPRAETLLGMSGRWLVAEMDGDLDEAIAFREKELAVLRKHIAKGILSTAGLQPDEFNDRLELLASNYLDAGRHADALAVLDESEAFCSEHGIPFEGQALRTDVKRAMKPKKKRAKPVLR
jgi:hypothetical protein